MSALAREKSGMSEPWQLRLYKRSIKKRETVGAILRLLPPLRAERCLEIGCATGVTSYMLRQRGGRWTSVDFEKDHVDSARRLVGEDVHLTGTSRLEFPDEAFDVVVGINFLEHIEDDDRFVSEMTRVLRPGGQLVFTAPTGEKDRLGYHIKRLYGFTCDSGGFGHARDGYPPEVLRQKFSRAGLGIETLDTYSRFFTESIEDTLNYAYHRKATKKKEEPGSGEDFHGATSPMSEEAFSKVSLSFRLYALAYPVIRGITLLDHLIPWNPGYMLVCRARKGVSLTPPTRSGS